MGRKSEHTDAERESNRGRDDADYVSSPPAGEVGQKIQGGAAIERENAFAFRERMLSILLIIALQFVMRT